VRALGFFNPRGDLFATAISFAAQGAIKLGSSILLTRILYPEAYGVATVLLSIAFVVELIADMNVVVFIVRDEHAEEPVYLNTAWTIRLSRATLNTIAVFLLAPVISNGLYHLPSLTDPLRVFSIYYVLGALESMAFPLAIRHKNSRIIMYSELAATFVSSVFTILYCHFSRDYWGLILGSLLNRAVFSLLSYMVGMPQRPKLEFEWPAARRIFGFSKYVMPSGFLTLVLNQFDKVVFLRLFDLHLLGLYGLAANIAAPIESLIAKINEMVLYPRCAHNFRADPSSVAFKYYRENLKLFASTMIVPGAVLGAAPLVVAVLYPTRFSQAGIVLQAFMLRACLTSLAMPAEELLIAVGEYQVILVGSVYRVLWVFCGSLLGYALFGFMGFLYGYALSVLPALIYYFRLQWKKHLMIFRYEIYRLLFLLGIASSSHVLTALIRHLWQISSVRI
jgi:lipopolysaccharide exporter